MRKIIYIVFVFIFLVITPSAWAQIANPSSVVSLPAQVDQESPSVAPNIISVKVLTLLMARLRAVVLRSDNISRRINTRLTKLNSNADLPNSRDKMTKLATQQKTFAMNLEQLKTDLEQLDITSQTLSTSSGLQKEYPILKNKVLVFTKNLKDIYKQESDLVAEMKKIASSSVIPSTKVVPTQ